VGELRWRPPVAAPPWSGTREALAFGDHCPQLASPFSGLDGEPGTASGSEDCLYLNVYAPRIETGALPHGAARLPVMVWIHGGGNTVGLSDFYDGGRLAVTEKLIVVTVNYRLGPLGWFRHAALREAAAGPEERSGNFATLDLMAALQWVRANIAAFGGDPGRVTVFGESAGGRNVVSLLLSPQAAGLFHRAIVQSGGTNFRDPLQAESWTDDATPGHRNSSNEVIARLLVADERAKDRADARRVLAAMPAPELAAWLRGKPPAQLFSAYHLEETESLLDVPQVFADGAVLPEGEPTERFARTDGWNRVPVMIGTTKDENKVFQFTNDLYVRRWLGVIPRVREPELYLATAQAMTAMWKATGADGPAAAMRRSQDDVFVYRFDWDEEPSIFGTDLARFVGAAHGFEVPFVFGHYDLGRQGNVVFTPENRPGREELTARMMSYWAQFAYDGDPGRGRRDELPQWTAWDPSAGGHKTMHLDTGEGGLRMGSEPVTVASVLDGVAADARLKTPRDRCWVFRELAYWGRGSGRVGYDAREECKPFPFDGFPWT
jgi:para-nitrobenzyl esterase